MLEVMFWTIVVLVAISLLISTFSASRYVDVTPGGAVIIVLFSMAQLLWASFTLYGRAEHRQMTWLASSAAIFIILDAIYSIIVAVRYYDRRFPRTGATRLLWII